MNLPRTLIGLASLSLCLGLVAQEETRGGNAAGRATPRVFPTVGSTGMMPGNRPLGTSNHDMNRTMNHRNVIVTPPATARCTVLPTEREWGQRDILGEIQHMARRGLIPVVPIRGDVDSIVDVAYFPAGWKAYGFTVPANGELEVRLAHPNLGWFRLIMVDKWGSLSEGMLQNVIHTGSPVVTFKNPKNTPKDVFVIADDPGWMSSATNPYTISVKRNWDPTKQTPETMPATVGIWAKHGGSQTPVTVAAPAAESAPAPAASKSR